MAKRKSRTKSTKARRMSGRAFLRSLSGRGGPVSAKARRIKRRRTSKYKRSINYWKEHGNMLFSKIDIRYAERVWLEHFAPEVVPVLVPVPGAEHSPSYKKGLWDGKAWFVQFETRELAGQFKSHVWGLRI